MSQSDGSIKNTLEERGLKYGEFKGNAGIAQALKDVMRLQNPSGWDRLATDQKEALEVIASKIGRMINGNPDYADNWHDIAGYALLVESRLKERNL